MRTYVCFAVTFLALPPAFAAKNPGNARDTMTTAGRMAQNRLRSVRRALSARGAEGACVNEPDCEEAPITASTLQSETSIAIDSTGQHIVVGFNDFRGFSNPTVSISGFAYSDDGGTTFVDGGQLPTGPTSVIAGQPFPQIYGDPDIKYLGDCNFVYSSILVKAFGTANVVQTLSVHRSTDCGHTWSNPVEVVSATNPGGSVDVNGSPEDTADKELSDVDPDTKRFMLCWTNFTSGLTEMSCTYSDNILANAPVFSPRRVVAVTAAEGQGSSVRFAGNGSPNTYLVWSRFPGTLSGYANNIGFARSTDNGVTWSAPASIANDFVTMDYVLGNDRINNNPSLAVDKSSGPFSGNVYVVYSNNNSRDGADIAFQRSINGGTTFSAPVLLNASPGRDRPQWFPFVTVDPVTGRVWVFFYDQGVAPAAT